MGYTTSQLVQDFFHQQYLIAFHVSVGWSALCWLWSAWAEASKREMSSQWKCSTPSLTEEEEEEEQQQQQQEEEQEQEEQRRQQQQPPSTKRWSKNLWQMAKDHVPEKRHEKKVAPKTWWAKKSSPCRWGARSWMSQLLRKSWNLYIKKIRLFVRSSPGTCRVWGACPSRRFEVERKKATWQPVKLRWIHTVDTNSIHFNSMNTQKTTPKKTSPPSLFLSLVLLVCKSWPFQNPGLFSSSCTSANVSKAFGSSRNQPRCVVVEVTPSSRSQCLSGFLSLGCPFSIFEMHMDVSKNRGTPKSSILIGCSLINHLFWGTPIFGNTHIVDGRNSTASKRYENRFSKKKGLIGAGILPSTESTVWLRGKHDYLLK